MTQYTEEMQKYILEFLVNSPNSFARCQTILKPEYFDTKLRKCVSFIQEYSNEHRTLPQIALITAQTGINMEKYQDINSQQENEILLTVGDFCKQKAMEIAIYSAPERIAKGEYNEVESEIKKAILITLDSNLGTNYFSDPKGRIIAMRDRKNTVSTGWKSVDEKLFGGLNKGEFTLFAGNAGMGKSLFLQNISLNWLEMGLDVVYVTFELSENLVSSRIDSMITEKTVRELWKDLDETELRIKMFKKGKGNLQIKYMNAGTTTNDLRAYLKEYSIQHGKNPDAIAIDYLDLMYPNNNKINPSDMFIKDKYVSEELRALSADYGTLMVSASQLNRCLTLDTKVTINGVEKNISNIKIGDYVESQDGVKLVKDVFPVQKQPVFEIKTKSGKTIKASGKHIFPTSNGQKMLMDIKVGDKIFIKR